MGLDSASTAVSALSARTAAGLKSASTAVGATDARSARNSPDGARADCFSATSRQPATPSAGVLASTSVYFAHQRDRRGQRLQPPARRQRLKLPLPAVVLGRGDQ